LGEKHREHNRVNFIDFQMK